MIIHNSEAEHIWWPIISWQLLRPKNVILSFIYLSATYRHEIILYYFFISFWWGICTIEIVVIQSIPSYLLTNKYILTSYVKCLCGEISLAIIYITDMHFSDQLLCVHIKTSSFVQIYTDCTHVFDIILYRICLWNVYTI